MNLNKTSQPKWSEVTGIFGGRFDPPHLGHREAVRGLFQYPGLKQVLVVPSASPPHKLALASSEVRAEMAHLNFQATTLDPSYPTSIKTDLIELERAKKNHNQPSYSFDTIQELRRHYSSLAFIIGADQLKDLPHWHRFPEILGLCHWIVLERKPFQDKTALTLLHELSSSGLVQSTHSSQIWTIKQTPYCLILAPTEAPPLSSTKIRETLAKAIRKPDSSEIPDGILPEVWHYLKNHQLYGI